MKNLINNCVNLELIICALKYIYTDWKKEVTKTVLIL